MGSRTWIKVYCNKWISGTLREESVEIRGVWIDLLTLAGTGQYGDTGEIKIANGIGYTDVQIAEILHIKKPLWCRAKQRFLETDRIKVSLGGAISIVNWSKYQSEYERQKPYREAKRDDPTPEPKSPFTNPLEKEKEKESEKLHIDSVTKSYTEKLQDFSSDLSQGTPTVSPSGKPLPLIDNGTWRERVASYLREHGASSPTAIAKALGLPRAKYYRVNLTLSQHKGATFENPERGVWVLRDDESE